MRNAKCEMRAFQFGTFHFEFRISNFEFPNWIMT
jgi:hypothetical protein